MNTADLRSLADRAEGVQGRQSVRLPEVHARIRALRRRRRAAAVAGAAALALVVAGTAVIFRQDAERAAPAPATPSPSLPNPTPTGEVMTTLARPLTYSDDWTVDPGDIHWLMKGIHYGDRVLRPGIDATAMDLTDDGLVMVASDGGIHFIDDGETTEKIGETVSPEGRSWVEWGVKTSTSGSLVAWLTREGPDLSLVVYDTHEHRVLAKVRVPDECLLEAVVGDRVYYSGPGAPVDWPKPKAQHGPLMVLDVPTETVSETDARALSEDLRSHARGFVMGDNYGTGEVVNQDISEAVFKPRGSTLELQRIVRITGADVDGDGEGDGPVVYGYGGFDTTGRRLNLRLPVGYTPENSYALFQWLDDDRFAVMAGAASRDNFGEEGGSGYGDILVCDIPRERCTLAAPGPPGGASTRLRLVPHLTLPN